MSALAKVMLNLEQAICLNLIDLYCTTRLNDDEECGRLLSEAFERDVFECREKGHDRMFVGGWAAANIEIGRTGEV